MPTGVAAGARRSCVWLSETAVAFARWYMCGSETGVAFAGEKWVFLAWFSVALVMLVSRWSASVVAEVSLVSTSSRYSCLCAKKFALLGPMVGASAKKFALRTKNGQKLAVYGVLGELFRGRADGWGSSPVEWCNRFVSFGLGYALSGSGGSSCPVGWGVSRDLVRMSRLR